MECHPFEQVFKRVRLLHVFISKTFISNTRLRLAKNQAKAKQHPEAELLLFKNYTLHPFTLSKTNMRFSKKYAKNKFVCFNESMWLITMKMRLKMRNGSHRYKINRTRRRYGHMYTKYRMCLSMMMIMCNKQHLSNI